MKRQAFTLIEVLVAVAIVTLLSGVILSAFGQAKAGSKASVCQSNLRQIGEALLLYGADHDDAIPLEVHPYIATALSKGSRMFDQWGSELKGAPIWPSAALKYGATKELFHCPLDTGSQPGLPSQQPAYVQFGTSYLNDTLGPLFLKTFSGVPDSSVRTLAFDSLGSNHGPDGKSTFGGLASCLRYDNHVSPTTIAECGRHVTTYPGQPGAGLGQ